MAQTNDVTPNLQVSLGKRMLLGGIIGLLLISLFLVAGTPNPEWGKFWRIRPLILVPFAGAMGGLCNYLLMRFHRRYGLHKMVAGILSLLVFIVGLWIGIVLGLAGTYWD